MFVLNCFTVYVVETIRSNTVYKTVKLLPQNTKCPTTTWQNKEQFLISDTFQVEVSLRRLYLSNFIEKETRICCKEERTFATLWRLTITFPFLRRSRQMRPRAYTLYTTSLSTTIHTHYPLTFLSFRLIEVRSRYGVAKAWINNINY